MRRLLSCIALKGLFRTGLRFAFWGAVSYGLAFGMTWIFVVALRLGDKVGYACVQVCIFPVNYYLAKNHIFEAPGKSHGRCVPAYTATSLGCRALDWLVFNVLRLLGVPRPLAVLGGLVIVYPAKFTLYKLIVFKE
jgi:putative flippase GtrA